MITKEELKKEVDKLPENLVEEVYAILRRDHSEKKLKGDDRLRKWANSLEKFSPDFMVNRNQPARQIRDSFE